MKTWNLSNFDEFTPKVWAPKDPSVTAVPQRTRRRPLDRSRSTVVGAAIASVVIVAAMAVATVRVDVSGSDDTLRLSAAPTSTNVQEDRPPLALLFGGKFANKWDAVKESEMLARAAAAVAASSDHQNEANLIHSVLREKLPAQRSEADDLASLRAKHG